MFIFSTPFCVFAGGTPSLGISNTFGILSSTYTANGGVTAIDGDLGYITLSGSGTNTVTGTTHSTTDTVYNQAGVDQGVALSALNSQACTFNFTGVLHLGSDTTHGPIGIYPPGVYCSTGSMDIDGGSTINLSGVGTYIFRSGGAFDTSDNSVVAITAGASACDIFFTPDGATTLGANTVFVGSVIPVSQDITVGNLTSWTGRALSFGHTITTDTNSIIVPTCTIVVPPPLPATLHVIKLVVNGSGGTGLGTATSSDFLISIKDASSTNVLGSPMPGVAATGTMYLLSAGVYTASEDLNTLYVRSFSGDCDVNGNIILVAGDNKICTITNTDIPIPPISPVSAIVAPRGNSGHPPDTIVTPALIINTPVVINQTVLPIADVAVITTSTSDIEPVISIESSPGFPTTGLSGNTNFSQIPMFIMVIFIFTTTSLVLYVKKNKAISQRQE